VVRCTFGPSSSEDKAFSFHKKKGQGDHVLLYIFVDLFDYFILGQRYALQERRGLKTCRLPENGKLVNLLKINDKLNVPLHSVRLNFQTQHIINFILQLN